MEDKSFVNVANEKFMYIFNAEDAINKIPLDSSFDNLPAEEKFKKRKEIYDSYNALELRDFLKLAFPDKPSNKYLIDERLVPHFKNALKRIQEYFNANGYTLDRNYEEHINKYLFNMSFVIRKFPSKLWGGYFVDATNSININEARYECRNIDVESIICHEFIHFLVMKGLQKDKCDADIYNGGFQNEALTEMLTQQIYPKSNSYRAQVAMQTYANKLSGHVNNFQQFLKGFIDARYSSSNWENYRSNINDFQKEFTAKGYIDLPEAITNKNYINAQRSLINLFIRPTSKKTIDEYIKCIELLIDRPVPDDDFIKETLDKLDSNMVNNYISEATNLNLSLKNILSNDQTITNLLKSKLKEIRRLVVELQKYDGKPVFELKLGDKTIAIDENYKCLGDTVNTSIYTSPEKIEITIIGTDTKYSINKADLDFYQRERELTKRIREISSYFKKESIRDLTMLSYSTQVSETPLLKLERFDVPVFDNVKRNTTVTMYVATYPDRIEVLNNFTKINNVADIPVNKFLGLTSKNPKTALFMYDKLGTIENGILFSDLTSQALKHKAINVYTESLKPFLSNREIDDIIDEYMESDEYIETSNYKDLKEDAIMYYSSKAFLLLSDEAKEEIYRQVYEQNTKYIISSENGELSISYLYGDAYPQAFVANKTTVYDCNVQGRYQEEVQYFTNNSSLRTRLESGTLFSFEDELYLPYEIENQMTSGDTGNSRK